MMLMMMIVISGQVLVITPHNLVLSTMGTILLWFGWYGFNGMSSGGLTHGGVGLASWAMVNTTIGAAAGGLVAYGLSSALSGVKVFDSRSGGGGARVPRLSPLNHSAVTVRSSRACNLGMRMARTDLASEALKGNRRALRAPVKRTSRRRSTGFSRGSSRSRRRARTRTAGPRA